MIGHHHRCHHSRANQYTLPTSTQSRTRAIAVYLHHLCVRNISTHIMWTNMDHTVRFSVIHAIHKQPKAYEHYKNGQLLYILQISIGNTLVTTWDTSMTMYTGPPDSTTPQA